MSDMLLGVVGLAVLLGLAFGIGYVYFRFKQARFKGAWSSLTPLVSGTVHAGDTGGGSSWLTGAYRGHAVQATMIPDRNIYSGEDSGGWTYNYFEVAFTGVQGRSAWRISYAYPVLGFGASSWQLAADSPVLQQALEQTGVTPLVAALGQPPSHLQQPVLEFDPRVRILRYREDAGRAWLPTPQRFQAQLELLVALEAINQQYNVATNGAPA